MGEKWPVISTESCDFHAYTLGFFYMPHMRHGTQHDFPSKGRRAEDFFALKYPTASAGFEPANLGTNGQHATSRPPEAAYQVGCKFKNGNVGTQNFPQTVPQYAHIALTL